MITLQEIIGRIIVFSYANVLIFLLVHTFVEFHLHSYIYITNFLIIMHLNCS